MTFKEMEEYTDRFDARQKLIEEVFNERKKRKALEERKKDTPDLHVGDRVSHRLYKTGIITNINGEIITVSFENDIKKFKIPDAIIAGFISIDV